MVLYVPTLKAGGMLMRTNKYELDRQAGVAARRATREAKKAAEKAAEQTAEEAAVRPAKTEAELVELRRARQKEYRAKQLEVGRRLVKLWRLREARERGGLPGLPLQPSPVWDTLLAFVNRLIHEEEAIHAALTVAKEAGRVAGGRPATAGLSTVHNTRKGGNGRATRKKDGNNSRHKG
jgi:hypothetical protein